MLLVQEFLENKSFGELASEHGVYASFSKSGHKFSLNYDMIEVKNDDPLSQQCRGLILALEDGSSILGEVGSDGKINRDNIIPGKTQILAYPMNRFFNLNQGECAVNLNDPKLAVLSKLDGSLCIIYNDKITNQWCVATRAVSDADLLMDNGIYTFRTLFEKALMETIGMSFDLFTKGLVKEMTYCFELTTPYNRIVVQYPKCGITLLAVRYLPTLKEIEPSELALVQMGGVPCVQTYTYTTMDDIVKWVSEQNPLEHEGVVIRDSQFNRIKVKNINYVLLGKARDTIVNERAFLNLILNEKQDDVWSVLPEEFQNRILELQTKLSDFNSKIMEEYSDISKQSTSKKEFALLVKSRNVWGAPLFQMFDKKCNNFKEFILLQKKDNMEFSNSFLDKLLSVL